MFEIMENTNIEQYKKIFKENEEKCKCIQKLREIGENESMICQIIRKDLLDDFIKYLKYLTQKQTKETNSNSILKSLFYQKISDSQFETHPYLILSHSSSIISYSAFFGSIKIFNYLFKIRFDPKTNESICQILYKDAINSNNIKILQLIEQNNIIPRDTFNRSIYNEFNITTLNHLEVAISCHHNEIAQYIKKNYDITANDFIALQSFNYLFIDDFYNRFCNDDCSLLYYLCFYDYPKFAQLLINNKNIDIDEYSKTNKLKDKAKYLRVINASDKDKIIQALIRNNSNLVKFLIEQKNMKIEFTGKSLIDAIYNEDIELIKIMMLQSDIDVNIDDRKKFAIGDEECNVTSPLILAITKNNFEIIDLLLKYPLIDVNFAIYPNCDRTTKRNALHIAILLENIELIKILLNRPDIDVNAITNFDETTFRFYNWSTLRHFDLFFTPLQVAIEINNIEILSLLLQHPKILVNELEVFDFYSSGVKQTALCRAIQKKNSKIVELLLKQPDIDVNLPAVYFHDKSNENDDKNIIKKTPLHCDH